MSLHTILVISGTNKLSNANVERYAKDVTVRYVKNYPGKAKRWRIREYAIRDANGQIVMYDWFKRTLGVFRRNEKSVFPWNDIVDDRIVI
jgi:hypothetical protein